METYGVAAFDMGESVPESLFGRNTANTVQHDLLYALKMNPAPVRSGILFFRSPGGEFMIITKEEVFCVRERLRYSDVGFVFVSSLYLRHIKET